MSDDADQGRGEVQDAGSVPERGWIRQRRGDIGLNVEQAGAIAKLLTAASKDVNVKARLAANPNAVLKEFGLDSLVEGRDIRVSLDISAYQEALTVGGINAILGFHIDANTGHADSRQHFDASSPHADTSPHLDFPALHADSSHQDIPPLHFDI